MEAELLTGIVLWFNPDKKYGFVQDLNSRQDYFMHISGLVDGIAVHTDDKVTFKAGERNGRPIAKDVQKI